MNTKLIFEIGENVFPPTESIYVRATESDIRKRMYVGGFLRFLSSIYDLAENYPRGGDVNGKKIMSLRQFDKWRKEHSCC